MSVAPEIQQPTGNVEPQAAEPAPAQEQVQAQEVVSEETPQAPEAQEEVSSSPADLIDVEQLDVEKQQQQASEQKAQAAKPKEVEVPETPDEQKEFFNLLNGELGDLPELEDMKLDGFYKSITPEHIKELPAVARQIIHNVRRAHALEQNKQQAAIQKAQEEYNAKARALAQREKDMLRREQEMAAVIESPEVQKLFTTPDGELPDPLTEEGIEARIKRHAAEGLKQIFKPMQQSAEARRRELAYKEFVEANPEMRDESFVGEMRELMQKQKAAGEPISTQTAHKFVKLSRLEKEQKLRAQRERQARAQSAQRVSRTTSTGTPNTGEIPDHVRKDAVSLYNYFKDNPEAKRRVDSTR